MKLRFSFFPSVKHLVSDYVVDISLKMKARIFTDRVEINRYANETISRHDFKFCFLAS